VHDDRARRFVGAKEHVLTLQFRRQFLFRGIRRVSRLIAEIERLLLRRCARTQHHHRGKKNEGQAHTDPHLAFPHHMSPAAHQTRLNIRYGGKLH